MGSQLDGLVGRGPTYHAPAFVLTHHPRDPVTMQGGTTFTLEPLAARAASLTTHISYRVLH